MIFDSWEFAVLLYFLEHRWPLSHSGVRGANPPQSQKSEYNLEWALCRLSPSISTAPQPKIQPTLNHVGLTHLLLEDNPRVSGPAASACSLLCTSVHFWSTEIFTLEHGCTFLLFKVYIGSIVARWPAGLSHTLLRGGNSASTGEPATPFPQKSLWSMVCPPRSSQSGLCVSQSSCHLPADQSSWEHWLF